MPLLNIFHDFHVLMTDRRMTTLKCPYPSFGDRVCRCDFVLITLAFVTLLSATTNPPITKIRNLEAILYSFLITNQL